MQVDQETDDSLGRLGVMGGTFDPMHLGHLIIASEALYALELDRMVFMPTGQPWQKKSYAPAEDRYLMTVLGARDNRRFAVSRMELDRVGPTYTADTMEALRSFHGAHTQMFFIVGADAVLKLGTWERIELLGQYADIVAVNRPGFELKDFQPQPTWPKVQIMDCPPIGISSTDIRSRVRHNRPIDYLVPEAVAAYIGKHGLYVGDNGHGS
jgi:nicotinate-nucleotide adenylyltransferase